MKAFLGLSGNLRQNLSTVFFMYNMLSSNKIVINK